jgi:hypothetical protein
MEDPTVEAVQRITGRKVIGYHSPTVFHPERAVESSCSTAPSTIRAEPGKIARAPNFRSRRSPRDSSSPIPAGLQPASAAWS